MSQLDGVLVYDGDCPFCSASASAVRQLDTVGTVSWDDEAAQRALEAQFADVPFALVFFDLESEFVFAGREAARELSERAGMPGLVQDIIGENYESLADAIRTVTGVERAPDPYHGVFPLADQVNAHVDALTASAEQPRAV